MLQNKGTCICTTVHVHVSVHVHEHIPQREEFFFGG